MPAPHYLLADRPYASYAEYLAHQGDFPAGKLRRSEIIAELDTSGLRGRGGAGFPTGTKWKTLAGHPCQTRYVVCNAAEGEPGTFKDRYLLRHNPYATLEGIVIACRAIQAKEAYIAIKASFAKEISSLRRAIGELQEAGLFEGISLHLIQGPEEYLFGEEKAMLNVIEGEGPFPRPVEEPPYEKGLFATPLSPNPALVNNVQTFAHVASIARFGGASFRELGTEDTPGTLLVTLCGDVVRPGVYETEAGLGLQEMLERFGGGSRPGRNWKAVLCGVSAGAVLPKDLGVRAEFAAMKGIGAGLGSAGFIAIDTGTSILQVVRALARFLYVESCNQCSACKAGLRIASTGLDSLGSETIDVRDDLVKIREAAESAPQGNRCYLPVQAAQLIPSLLDAFAKEFRSASAEGGIPAEAWALPKILDFDETKRVFQYDERQPLKQPDWTYLEEREESV